MINVTKPFLPPKEEYLEYVKSIWDRVWLTNNGPLVNDLELKLKEYLQVDHLLFLGNGTIALQIAIKALQLKGEIITTPFSYVATTSSIVWEGCTPVFADIDPKSFNIVPSLIEEKITKKTVAILATHVFGNACDVIEIQKIADKHNLKIIYDAAHAFAVKVKGKSIFEYGDISTTSFHSTKLFHTIEGGAVFTRNADLLKRMSRLRNFGHITPESFDGVGINGKNSEFHAAMGLCNLKYIDKIVAKRKQQWMLYVQLLQNLNVDFIDIADGIDYNYSYFPIVFKSEESLKKNIDNLNMHQIYPRRYFYPSLNNLAYVKSSPCPVSDSISSRVLCLPLYFDLSFEEQEMVARVLLRIQNN